jgi:hypothetical protein
MSEPTVEHYCTGCGERHGGTHGKDAEVRIAEINAKRDIEVARIQRGETRLAVETAAGAELAVAEVQAEADVAVAAELAPALAEGAESGSEPLVLADGPVAEPEPEPDAPSIEPAGETSSPPPAEKKSRGYWG